MRTHDPFAALAAGSLARMRVNHSENYFAFKEEHGEPEDDGTQLLFHDGWTRSNLTHKARPVAPPPDPVALAAIQRRFWQLRSRECVKQIAEIHKALAAFGEVSEGMPGPVVVDVEEVDVTRRGWEFRWQPQVFDPATLIERLGVLEEALDQCAAALDELAGHPTTTDATTSDSVTNERTER